MNTSNMSITVTEIHKDGNYYKEKLCELLNEAYKNGIETTVHLYPSNNLVGIYFTGANSNLPLRNLKMISGTPVRPM